MRFPAGRNFAATSEGGSLFHKKLPRGNFVSRALTEPLATKIQTWRHIMAGVDVGSGGSKKRATNSDINMIPFIDLLFVTIAFLLITAVWTTNSRINANAEVPA